MDKVLLLYIAVVAVTYLAIGAVFALFLGRYSWLYGFACGDEDWDTDEIMVGWPLLLVVMISMILVLAIVSIGAGVFLAIYAVVTAGGKVVRVLKIT